MRNVLAPFKEDKLSELFCTMARIRTEEHGQMRSVFVFEKSVEESKNKQKERRFSKEV